MSDVELSQLQQRIEERVGEAEPDIEVLAVERAGDRLRVFIDHPGGVDLELCERTTRALEELLADWALEVSSPGPERPLSKPEHFRRFLGRTIRVKTSERIEGHRSFTGTLAEADDDHVAVDSGDEVVSIPLRAIHRSNLLPDADGGTLAAG